MVDAHADTTPSGTGGLMQQARRLAWATIAWNVIEAVVAITAGAAAGSLALIGFGLDSSIETLSAAVVLWRLNDVSDEREELALKLIAVSFFLLAAYVAAQSGWDLITRSAPDVSVIGMALTGLSLIVMPLLARAKQRVGRQMGSRVVVADSVETWLCTYLSVVVLAGLALNAAFSWWWADPIAALGIAYLAVREGREAWEGDDECC